MFGNRNDVWECFDRRKSAKAANDEAQVVVSEDEGADMFEAVGIGAE
jgi:hypothetical protein